MDGTAIAIYVFIGSLIGLILPFIGYFASEQRHKESQREIVWRGSKDKTSHPCPINRCQKVLYEFELEHRQEHVRVAHPEVYEVLIGKIWYVK